MDQTAKSIKQSVKIMIIVILLTFIIPILLLTKIIPVSANAQLANRLLYLSIPVSISTLLSQWIFYKLNITRLNAIKSPELRKNRLHLVYAIRLRMTLIAIIPNFIFLALTNFDLYLTINIVLLLWMINIFPFPDKTKKVLKDY